MELLECRSNSQTRDNSVNGSKIYERLFEQKIKNRK